MTEALAQQEIGLGEAASALVNTYFGDTEKEDESRTVKQRSVYILMLLNQEALNAEELPQAPPLDDADQKVICDMSRLLELKVAMPPSLRGCD
jgi:hypothetical protein